MILDTAAEFDVRDYLRPEMMPHFLCPGCGHGIALRALLWAIHDLKIDKDRLAVVSGIGCAGRLSAYIDANTFHVTHGRPLAYATGLALARPDLNVVVITGDGDCLAIGGNHLIHACRRNLKLTCLMLNNEVYGMTGGQVSPTTSETRLTTTTPLGNQEPHFDACALAAAAGAGFVGREVTHHVPKLKELIKAGLEHPGFAFVEVLTDCTEIFGRKNDMGSSPEMIMRQTSKIRPSAYSDTVDTPFRPNDLPTGILMRNDRPEYGAAYRRARPSARGPSDERAHRDSHRRHRRAGADPCRQDAGRCAGCQRQARRPGAILRADLARRLLQRRPGCRRRRGGFPAGDRARLPGAARPHGRYAVLAAAQARRAGHRRHAALPRSAGGRLSPLSLAAQPHRAAARQRAGDQHRRARRLGRAERHLRSQSGSSRRCAPRRRAASSISTWMRSRRVIRCTRQRTFATK